jgi:SAM-dependent methyltransferase
MTSRTTEEAATPVPTAPDAETQKRRVRAFWERTPCGSIHADAPEGTRDYFEQVERRRYELEPFIARYAEFAGSCGQHVLEIGVGLGTDLVQFARSGAHVTGVDLTEHAVTLVRRRLELEGLSGDVRVADAEKLPFEDGSFDLVYSWGVLHHTPDTRSAAAEALRVLRPGGKLCVMLYGRYSWVAFGLWVRFAFLRGRPWTSLSDLLAEHMESEGTKGFTRRELEELFDGLDDLVIQHVGTAYDRRIAGPLVRVTGRLLGWFVVIRGTKPASAA